LDARSGNLLWDVPYAEGNKNYGATSAPLVVKDKVLVGNSDRKSTRLNSSHGSISYAVFCLKKIRRSPKKLVTRDNFRYFTLQMPFRTGRYKSGHAGGRDASVFRAARLVLLVSFTLSLP